jgi:hypothetical protein
MRRPTTIAPVMVAMVIASVACGGPGDRASGGVRGVALAGPRCPVVVEGSPCPDLPWRGTVRVITTDGDVIEEASTSADGRFEIALDPGEYIVVAVLEPGGIGGAIPSPVTVGANAWTDVTLSVDTGIR